MCILLLMLSRNRIRYAWFILERKAPLFNWTLRRGNKWSEVRKTQAFLFSVLEEVGWQLHASAVLPQGE